MRMTSPLAILAVHYLLMVFQIAEFKCQLTHIRNVASSIEASPTELSDALQSLQSIVNDAGQHLQQLDELVECRLRRNEKFDKNGNSKSLGETG